MYQRVGTRFGTFNIRHVLGVGGMAAVYYAIDTNTQQPIALKILASQLAEISAFRQRFELEAQITSLLYHPHIVPVVAYGAIDESLYIAMRYLSGGSLHDKFVLDGKVSLRDTARYLNDLAPALDYAHNQGVIHRDLKLANVLLDEEGNALLSDFGIARMLESSLHLTESGSVLGSPHYMSPEQNEGKPLDARSDLYSLAVMVYLMITGQFPFHADTPVAIALQHVTKPPPAPTTLNPTLPPAVDPVLLKGLAKAPSDRFASAAEFASAFERAVGDCDTQTMIHLPQLSLSRPTPARIPTPPPQEPVIPLIEVVKAPIEPTEPSLPIIKKKPPRRLWRLVALPVVAVMLWAALRFGIAQFGPNHTLFPTDARPVTATISPATASGGVIVLPTLTLTLVPSDPPVATLSVIVKDLHQPVNVRSGPARVYEVIGQMYAVDQPIVIARTGSRDASGYYWYLVQTIRSPRLIGWVSAEAVDLFPVTSNPFSIPIAATIPATPTASNTPRPVTSTPVPPKVPASVDSTQEAQ